MDPNDIPSDDEITAFEEQIEQSQGMISEDDFMSSPGSSPPPSPPLFSQQSNKHSGSQQDDSHSDPDLGKQVPRWCYAEQERARPKRKRRRSTRDGVGMAEMKDLLLKVCKKVEQNEKYLKELQHRLVDWVIDSFFLNLAVLQAIYLGKFK